MTLLLLFILAALLLPHFGLSERNKSVAAWVLMILAALLYFFVDVDIRNID